MVLMFNLKLYFIYLIKFLVPIFIFSEPFLSPHDPFIRHELRLLQDHGNLNSTINSWPINLGGLRKNEVKNSWTHDLLGEILRKESNTGLSTIESKICLAEKGLMARSFMDKPRGGFTSGVETSWMNDHFAGKLSLIALYDVEKDWKGRKDEGLALDGSYIAARLGNWSASLGKVDRWWGPGWDGSLILSTNARPIPAVSIDRLISEPFESQWLSWIGPWSFHSFIGQMEKERTVANPYLWGIRVDFNPTILDGLEVGLFRMMQLGGDGYPSSFSVWIDAFLSQDNFHSYQQGKSTEPGNQLAGVDFRWKVLDLPIALYCQIAGEDEDGFLPEALFFQYGIEGWTDLSNSTLRFFAEYVDLTSYWRTGDPNVRNVTYSHGRYEDGYRYRGRPIGHWADTDSRIFSFGGLLQNDNGIGWGSILRSGDLNEDGSGNNSVSNGVASDYFAIEVFNSLSYDNLDLSVQSSIGWEEIEVQSSSLSSSGLTFSSTVTKLF